MDKDPSQGDNIHLIEGKDLESIVLVKKMGEENVNETITVHYTTEDIEPEEGEKIFKISLSDEELEHEASLAKWTRKYINSLPNSSFAVVESCADERKDARHLPYKDENGKIDLSHLKNALARMNQIKSVCGGSDEALRAKARRVLLPLAKKYFPNSQFLSEESPAHIDSSSSGGEDKLSETSKNDELSKIIEGLATKDELEKLRADREAILKEVEKLKTEKVMELAETVFAREVELGITKEDDRDSRIKTLMGVGEESMNLLLNSYNAIPKKTENSEPAPKAANLSATENKLSAEKEEEVCAELRERWFGHRTPKQKVRPLGRETAEEGGAIRYIEVPE